MTPSQDVGYEPTRVHTLRTLAAEALDDLDHLGSDDPATAGAVVALARLRSVLSDTWLPTVERVAGADPLGRLHRRSRARSLTEPVGSRTAGADWYAAWLRELVDTPFRAMTDDELLAELESLERDVPYTDDVEPDLDDPFWDEFAPFAAELAVRAETDGRFADRLVEHAASSFLIPLAVRFVAFDPDLVGEMLFAVSRSPSAMDDLLSNYQALGAETLMTFLVEHPGIALDVLARPGPDLLKELLEWPLVDPSIVHEFLGAAMDVPFDDAGRLTDAYLVLQNLTVLANRRLHESGFPPRHSPTITRIVVQYLPFFVTSLGPGARVWLKDFDMRDVEMPLGTVEEVIDLVGALMRDPESLHLLLGSITIVAMLAAEADGPFAVNTDDLAAFVDLLRRAAENEQTEERLAAAEDERIAALVIDVLVGVAEVLATVLAPTQDGGIDIPFDWAKDGMKAFVRWSVTATDLDLDDIGAVTFLLLAFGLSVGVLRHRDDADDVDDVEHRDHADRQLVEVADELVERIEERLGAGAPLDEVEGLIDDLTRAVGQLDPDTMAVLDDSRVTRRPPGDDGSDSGG